MGPIQQNWFVVILCTVALGGQCVAAELGRSSPLLRHALELADLNNWGDAEPEFAKAAAAFRQNGDRTGLAYAELGLIRASIQRRNLSATSAELLQRLSSDPLLKSDRELRLFCLAIKGDIDGEMAATAMRKDWEEVAQLAQQSADPRWKYRASAELGKAAFYEGDLETARRNIGAALVAATQANDIGAQIEYLYAIGIGLSLSRMSNEAIPYLDKAIALSTATQGAPYPYMVYLARAEALAGQGKAAEARATMNSILQNARQRKASLYEAIALQALAQVARAQGNSAAALEALDQASQVCERAGYSRALIESQLALADIYRTKGDLKKAESLLVLATNASQKNGELYTLPQRLQILAGLQIAQGRFAEADRTFDRAAAFVDASIGNDSAVLDKTAWIKSVSDLYVAHFSLIAERLNNPAKAYAIVEQVRGRVMTDLLLGGSTASLKARENEKAISRLRLRMMEANATAEVEKIRNQMFLLEQARWVTPEVNILKAKGLAHVPLAAIQQALSPDAIILEYVLAEPSSWCLVIRKNGASIVRLGGKSKIDTLVSSYLKEVKTKLPAQSGSRELYDALIGPVAGAEKASNIMIVRDGLLNLLPFDAVREPSGRYLGERTVTSYLPSAGSFHLLAQQGKRSAPGTKVFAMGGIPYEQEAKRFQTLIATNGFSPAAVPNLQNSREEVAAATAGAIDANKQVVLGSAATESALKQAAKVPYRVMHLTVHSAVDPARPDRAALLMLSDPAGAEDGLLLAPEIAQLRLKSNLVVLSACDTAVGPIQGQEGVSTLARSFLLAGAQNVISTLWSADDTSSLTVIKQFYAHLASGAPPASALASAKRDFLAKFGSKAVPYYWAAFTFEGVPSTATNSK